ncbi:MAG: fused MFS/spermidine synthase [Candidatus Daviesbacteria bacterium]|nr:fused MFS/spermidine synthase [Candidatus Daviesbacteria bacterium]
MNSLEIIVPLLVALTMLLILNKFRYIKLTEIQSRVSGKIAVFKKWNGEKLLTINGFAQSVSVEDRSIKKSYWYKISELALKRSPQNILFLGLGAGSMNQIIYSLNKEVKQTVIELDPSIIDISQEFFEIDKIKSLKIIQADAFKVIRDPKKFALNLKFDVVIIDLYNGEPPYVSPYSSQSAFVTQITKLITPQGCLIFNRPDHSPEARQINQKLINYLSSKFKIVETYPVTDPRGYKNNAVVATNFLIH